MKAFTIAAALIFVTAPPSVSAGTSRVSNHRQSESQRGWMARDAHTAQQWVYVSGTDTNNVLVYEYGQSGATQIGAISDGISGPRCLSLDAAGNLYVANQNNATVTVYGPGATSPFLTLSADLQQPISAATDLSGNVWVTNDGATPSIVVYPPNQTTPSHVITNPLIGIPIQLTFDVAGNAFLADNTTGISEFPAGSLQPMSLHLEQIIPNSTNGVAVDSRNGLLFASFGNFHNTLNVYRIGRKRLLHAFTISTADGLAVAGKSTQKDLFVPGSQTNVVSVYRAGQPDPIASFAVATRYTRGIAVKPAGMP